MSDICVNDIIKCKVRFAIKIPIIKTARTDIKKLARARELSVAAFESSSILQISRSCLRRSWLPLACIVNPASDKFVTRRR